MTALAFEVPPALEAHEPPEARGLTRDGVRLMVAYRSTGELVHTTFSLLPAFLAPGDLVVVNTSGTIPGALRGTGTLDGTSVVVHLSTRLEDDLWVVEPRRPVGGTTSKWSGVAGELPPRHITLTGEGADLELLERYGHSDRLWLARLHVPEPLTAWLDANGKPIRYSYVDGDWPMDAYQNVYATESGSAEMPSAGRPFTPEIITRLVAKGVGVTPIVLHTGVASIEAGERPQPERVKVPRATAARVNSTRSEGGRVIAVGTSVVRALESAVDERSGVLQELDGWTDLVVTPEGGVHAVDALLTGWHEPQASHLLMLEAIAGRALLDRSYEASIEQGYLWHEFGDVHLVLP
ncbi:MAG TPA: S-adenosylmethionine:tRNA ribosyltransferase-isomerase [Acidimicrobiales bacterium]|nr:S-adenosylmethionine:tRNA ribosyltransferase-isomerase [Acidimicrobiales bacterium]